MEALVILRSSVITLVGLPSDTSHHLSNDYKINDQWRSQERILADIEQADRLMSTHENLRIVLIECALVVSNSWHVLDDHSVVRMLSRFVEHIVRFDHVVHNVGFGDLLGSELLLRAQVHAVIVAQMIVAGDRGEFDPRVDHEIYQSRLHLGLARFEVIATDEGAVLFGKFDSTRNEGILRRTIDERCVLKYASNCEYS